MKQQAKTIMGVSIMSVAVVVTAIICVYARHETRKQFTHLQVLIVERDSLEVEWGQLQIEQSTWSTHSRVEQLARQKMNMRNPLASEIRVVRQ